MVKYGKPLECWGTDHLLAAQVERQYIMATVNTALSNKHSIDLPLINQSNHQPAVNQPFTIIHKHLNDHPSTGFPGHTGAPVKSSAPEQHHPTMPHHHGHRWPTQFS